MVKLNYLGTNKTKSRGGRTKSRGGKRTKSRANRTKSGGKRTKSGGNRTKSGGYQIGGGPVTIKVARSNEKGDEYKIGEEEGEGHGIGSIYEAVVNLQEPWLKGDDSDFERAATVMLVEILGELDNDSDKVDKVEKVVALGKNFDITYVKKIIKLLWDPS
jgi:hypothetical protein